MSDWQSIGEIAEAYGGSNDDLRALSRKLRGVIKSNHPDRFPNENWPQDARNAYEKAEAALSFIKGEKGAGHQVAKRDEALGALIRQNRELIERIDSRSEVARREQRELALVSDAKASIERVIGRKYRRMKFSAAFLGAVGAFAILAKEQIASVYQSGLVSLRVFDYLPVFCVAAVIASGMMFLAATFREEVEKERRTRLLTDTGFIEFLKSAAFGKMISEENTFSLVDLAEAVGRFAHLDLSTSGEIAELFIARLEARELATRIPGPQLSPAYQLSPCAIGEMRLPSRSDT